MQLNSKPKEIRKIQKHLPITLTGKIHWHTEYNIPSIYCSQSDKHAIKATSVSTTKIHIEQRCFLRPICGYRLIYKDKIRHIYTYIQIYAYTTDVQLKQTILNFFQNNLSAQQFFLTILNVFRRRKLAKSMRHLNNFLYNISKKKQLNPQNNKTIYGSDSILNTKALINLQSNK